MNVYIDFGLKMSCSIPSILYLFLCFPNKLNNKEHNLVRLVRRKL